MNKLIKAQVTETNGFFNAGEIITVVFYRVDDYGKSIYKSVGESATQADGGWVISERYLNFIETTLEDAVQSDIDDQEVYEGEQLAKKADGRVY